MTTMADRRAHIDLLEAYRLTGDRDARDRLVEELMPLVRSLARRYAGRGEPIDDLVQVGAIGLIKAIDRFELERGVELSTYAVPTIVGEIRRHFRDRSWSVHVPRRMKELSLRVSRLVDDLSSELGRTPTVTELAAAADVEEEDVIEALETARAHTPASLSTPLDATGELTLIDLLGEEEEGYAALERGSVVRTGLEGLDERERRIIVLRFLKGMTQSEIAAELGISQMHVSRLLRRALATMRGRIEGLMDDADG
jgi:RNA polymerase sigma-B factor